MNTSDVWTAILLAYAIGWATGAITGTARAAMMRRDEERERNQ